jgi:hypothetical protein
MRSIDEAHGLHPGSSTNREAKCLAVILAAPHQAWQGRNIGGMARSQYSPAKC